MRGWSPIKIFGAVLVLLLVLGGVYFFRPSPTPPPPPETPPTTESRDQMLLRSDSYQRGDPGSPVSLVEFVDFQCGACGYLYPIVQKVLDEYPEKVSLTVRYWPLQQHKNAEAAVYAVETAGELGKYWEMYGLLMTRQSEWSESDNPWEVFVGWAKDLGLADFPADQQAAAAKFAAKVERDAQDAQTLQVKGVPHFFINGVYYGYLKTEEEFKEKIEVELALCDRTTLTEDDIDNGRLLCASDRQE